MSNRVESNQDFPQIDASNALYQRALPLIPSVTQTLAKGPTQHVNGVAPKYLQRGKGSHVWDVDGNEYLDLTMAVGPLSLGYCNDAVDQAIREQLTQGITFSLMHPLEVEVAELLRELVPNAQMVRYSKTGADVTSAAIRLARAYTGRDKVLCCGYHGWHDWYIGVTARDGGVPRAVTALVHTFEYNDLSSVSAALDDDTACVILEPMAFEQPEDDFLPALKQLCEQRGALLIFDEMWTGFRMALGGAQQHFAVNADLATFSKAVANGMPISVLAGRADVMRRCDDDVFFYTTFGGEALSLAAAKATLIELRDKRVPHHMARQGAKLKDGYNQLAQQLGLDFTRCVGMPARSMVTFAPDAGDPLLLKSLMQQELIRCGVLWAGFHNMCYAHSDDDVAHVLACYAAVLPTLGQAVTDGTVADQLKGEPLQPVFRCPRDFDRKPRP